MIYRTFGANMIFRFNGNKISLVNITLTRTSRNQEIFATKAQRHEGFYFVILSLSLGVLVARRKIYPQKAQISQLKN